jgi:hypothetical protein
MVTNYRNKIQKSGALRQQDSDQYLYVKTTQKTDWNFGYFGANSD